MATKPKRTQLVASKPATAPKLGAIESPRYSEERVAAMLADRQAGMPIATLTKKYNTPESTFYNWTARYRRQHGGTPIASPGRMIAAGQPIAANDARAAAGQDRMAELEQENRDLRQMFLSVSLEVLRTARELSARKG